MKRKQPHFRDNLALARELWGEPSVAASQTLREITRQFAISVASGDILFLNGKWYVTHAGLLRLALRRRCLGITTALLGRFSDAAANRWVFRAVVYRGAKSK